MSNPSPWPVKDTKKQQPWLLIALAVLLVCAVAGYKLYSSIIPMSAQYLAEKIPQTIYQQIGEHGLKSMDESTFSASELSAEKKQQVSELFSSVVERLQLEPESYQLEFRSWEETANAFALPGGTIILTDVLVEKMQNNEQLTAIILHEVGHIKQNHNMQNMIRTSLFYISLSVIFGDLSLVADLLIEASVMGVNLSYSRAFENEADAFSASSMRTLYGDVSALKQAMELLHEDSGQEDSEQENSWLSTHPGLAERLQTISAFD
ncbi:M48 family metallopeptidase [Thalassomonas actiniarum]|uniref:M48 family metallopeptidase n=1 Tax=Thalassomonas actiniarum TaxID=485447 RepID=A0AAE9YTN0_9GAMM|nr:M48 family metallopeptidase [Thalassomonas actiniarum]WDD99401.1 M48 family metallopeptidase [Thalassomonas actiniarum]